jgi:membrane associated rhomboid family serine protease
VRVLQGQQVIQVPALMVIGLWIVLQLFSGVGSIGNAADTGGVAYMAHIGGFAAGFVLTFLFRSRRGAAGFLNVTARTGVSRSALSAVPYRRRDEPPP